MPIGFPSSPTTGQEWPTVDPRWEWDGAKWVALPPGTPVTTIKPSPVGADRVILLDSAASYAPVLATLASLPGGGGAGALVTVTHNGGGANPVTGDILTAAFASGYTGSVQWQRNGTNIAGATNPTYTAVSADEGTTVRPQVTSLIYTATGLPVGAPAATVPAAFTVGQWDAAATATAGEMQYQITALPSNGGSAITALEYRVNTGSAIALTGTGTGNRTVTAGWTAGTAADTQVRAVNVIGAGAWSDIKNRTPLAAGSFSAAYVSHTINGTEFQNPKVFPSMAIGAADATRKVYVYLYARGPALADALTLSVNGGGALTPLVSERSNTNRQVLVFVADVPTGTTADFSFSSAGNDFNNCGIAVIRAVGAHSAASASSENFSSTSTGIATVAGDSVFLGAMYQSDGGTGFFGVPSGFTEHFDEPTRPSIPAQPATLRSGTAVGGSPETFTGTLVDTAGTSEVLLRLRSS